MPEISVIIPVYNVEKYLPKCLDSVINQTYRNFEIICVNDATPDNSAQILQEYAQKDSRIKIITHEKNRGLSAARNSGIEVAQGEYIYFIDSDDWIDLDYIEKMVKVAQQTGADIVVNKNILREIGGRSQVYDWRPEKNLTVDTYINGIAEVDKVVVINCTKFYKTAFIKENRLLYPVGYVNEDVYFHYITFALANKIYYTAQSYYHYFINENSITQKQKDVGVDHIKIFSKIYDFYKEHNLLNKKIKLYSTMPPFNIHNEESYQVYKSYFDKVIDYIRENAEVFNDLDLYFANSVANSKDYTEYAKMYPANVMISYFRDKIKKEETDA